MFSGVKVFNGDLSKWYVSSANDMSVMFSGAKALNDDISQWDVSDVIAVGCIRRHRHERNVFWCESVQR